MGITVSKRETGGVAGAASSARQAGFTLIELLLVVGFISAVVTAIVQGFDNQVNTATLVMHKNAILNQIPSALLHEAQRARGRNAAPVVTVDSLHALGAPDRTPSGDRWTVAWTTALVTVAWPLKGVTGSIDDEAHAFAAKLAKMLNSPTIPSSIHSLVYAKETGVLTVKYKSYLRQPYSGCELGVAPCLP